MISSILFFAFLIQASLGSDEEGFIINFQENGLLSDGCLNSINFEFQMKVITSGFTQPFQFNLTFSSPSYLLAFCTVPISTEGYNFITCYIDTTIFPLYKENKIIFPDTLYSSVISIEGWETNVAGSSITLNSYCGPSSFTYVYDQNEDSKFFIEYYNTAGNPVVSNYGSFKDYSQNYLKETEDYITYAFQPYYYSDGEIHNAYCEVYVPNTNSAEDHKISCEVKGTDEAFFFYTTAIEETDHNYVQVNILGNVSLDGTYLKLTGLLLLALLF